MLQVCSKFITLMIVFILCSCVRSETELLEAVETKIRSDPFIEAFRRNMEHAFGCKAESDVGSQEVSVYLSLYSVIGLREDSNNRRQLPTACVIIFCHSAVVRKVYIDLNLWRGRVKSFDHFKMLEPEMINRIRFEPSESFAWYISERFEGPGEPTDAFDAAISSRVWREFAHQVSSMFPQGCSALHESAVFYRESNPMLLAGVPYREFSSTLSCPIPGPSKPGFNFKGLFFQTKGFVLPLEIESGGAYVD